MNCSKCTPVNVRQHVSHMLLVMQQNAGHATNAAPQLLTHNQCSIFNVVSCLSHFLFLQFFKMSLNFCILLFFNLFLKFQYVLCITSAVSWTVEPNKENKVLFLFKSTHCFAIKSFWQRGQGHFVHEVLSSSQILHSPFWQVWILQYDPWL